MATNNNTKSERPVSKTAISATKKAANRFSREAERVQLSINKCLKDIEKLKARDDSMSTFALHRKENELKVLNNKFRRAEFRFSKSTSLLDSYVARNDAIRDNGSN